MTKRLDDETAARAAAAEPHQATQAASEESRRALEAALETTRAELAEAARAAQEADSDTRKQLRQANQELGKATDKAERLQAQLSESQEALEERTVALKVGRSSAQAVPRWRLGRRPPAAFNLFSMPTPFSTQELKAEVLALEAEQERLVLRNKRLQDDLEAKAAALASAEEREAKSGTEAATNIAQEAKRREEAQAQLQEAKAALLAVETQLEQARAEQKEQQAHIASLEADLQGLTNALNEVGVRRGVV